MTGESQTTPTDTDDLSAAIKTFERALPGWWWTVGHCMFSRDASCGPDRQGSDAFLLKLQETRKFDEGFHADLVEGSLADALRVVMTQALAVRKRHVKALNHK